MNNSKTKSYKRETDMANIEMNEYEAVTDGNTDQHLYMSVGAAVPKASPPAASPSVGAAVKGASPVASPRISGRAVCLSLSLLGGLCLCAAISSVTGVIVYHAMVGFRPPTFPEQETTNITDELNLRLNSIIQAMVEEKVTSIIQATVQEQLNTPVQARYDHLDRRVDLLNISYSLVLESLVSTNRTVHDIKISHSRILESLVGTNRSVHGIEEKLESSAQAQNDSLNKLEVSMNSSYSRLLHNLEEELKFLVQERYGNLDRRVDSINGSHNRVLDTLKDIEGRLDSSGKQVAFSVYNLNPSLIGQSTPTFQYTTVNTGSFDMSSGKFTCPTAGYYYFSLSFERDSLSKDSAKCYFYVNGSGRVYIRAYARPYEVASGSVIQHLSVNDVVSLSCSHGWQYVTKGLNNVIFSGFLISQD